MDVITLTVSVNGNGEIQPFKPDIETKYSWRVVAYNEDYTSVEIEYWEEPEPEIEIEP